ncbi:hypothetical protein MMC13_006847 [Lambiella insularis]|nr:hypothetical protein [Lambiella insularis]
MSEDDTYAPQSPDLSDYQSAQIASHSPAYGYPQQRQHQPQYQNPYQPPPQSGLLPPYQTHYPSHSPGHFTSDSMPRRPRADAELDDQWAPGPSASPGGRKSKKAKVEEDFDKPAPGAEEGIVVKTKFPVARIKRIMQADEDVGKVAQVTPTAVSKALELFMISLVTKAANQAKTKSAKKITAAHLKQVIEKDEQFDFLAEIISKVPDAPAPKKDEDSEGAGDGKKRKAATRRKKKEEEVDDS